MITFKKGVVNRKTDKKLSSEAKGAAAPQTEPLERSKIAKAFLDSSGIVKPVNESEHGV